MFNFEKSTVPASNALVVYQICHDFDAIKIVKSITYHLNTEIQ